MQGKECLKGFCQASCEYMLILGARRHCIKQTPSQEGAM